MRLFCNVTNSSLNESIVILLLHCLHFSLATRGITERLGKGIALVLAPTLLKDLLDELVPGARLARSLTTHLVSLLRSLVSCLACHLRSPGHLVCSTRGYEKTTAPKLLPGSGSSLKGLRPFRNGVLTSHRQITAITERGQIVDRRRTPFRFGDAVAGLKIKHSNLIGTPTNRAILFKHTPHCFNPDLLSERLGNRCLLVFRRTWACFTFSWHSLYIQHNEPLGSLKHTRIIWTVMASPVKLNMLVVSTHLYQTSGYSKVSYGLLKELAKQPFLNVTHFGIQGLASLKGNRAYPTGIHQYPIDTSVEQGFGFSQLAKAIETVNPHILFLYNDIGVIKTYMEKLGETPVPPYKIWLYVDQIYETIPSSCVTVLNKADRIFSFTKAWKDLFKKAGVIKPIDVLTHGFDTDLFPVIPRDDARTLMKIPKDVFLFMNVNRNQPRKHYDLLVMAFVELILKHPEKPIFLM